MNVDIHLIDHLQPPKTSSAPPSWLNLMVKPTSTIPTDTSEARKVATQHADDGPEAPATRQQSTERLPVRPLRRSSEDDSPVSSRSSAEAATYGEDTLQVAELIELYESSWFKPSGSSLSAKVNTVPAATACSITSSKASTGRCTPSDYLQAAAFVARCMSQRPIFAPRSADAQASTAQFAHAQNASLHSSVRHMKYSPLREVCTILSHMPSMSCSNGPRQLMRRHVMHQAPWQTPPLSPLGNQMWASSITTSTKLNISSCPCHASACPSVLLVFLFRVTCLWFCGSCVFRAQDCLHTVVQS